MRAICFLLALIVSLPLAATSQAQPLGLGTSPQGTATYAIGAAVAKVLTEKGNIQTRVQPSSGTGVAPDPGQFRRDRCRVLQHAGIARGL